MKTLLKLIVIGTILGLIDFIWLGFTAQSLYRAEIGDIILAKPNLTAAILFYIIYVIGVFAFVIQPALAKRSLSYAVKYGALLGFVCYATFDLTNLSILNGYTITIAVVDMLWGTILTATVSALSFTFIRRLRL